MPELAPDSTSPPAIPPDDWERLPAFRETFLMYVTPPGYVAALRGLPGDGSRPGDHGVSPLHAGTRPAVAHPRDVPHVRPLPPARQRIGSPMGEVGRSGARRRSRTASPAVPARRIEKGTRSGDRAALSRLEEGTVSRGAGLQLLRSGSGHRR